jgi:hypothetical protein
MELKNRQSENKENLGRLSTSRFLSSRKEASGHCNEPTLEGISLAYLGLGTEFRFEKIPRNRFGMVSVIPRKKALIPRHSEFRGRANSEART